MARRILLPGGQGTPPPFSFRLAEKTWPAGLCRRPTAAKRRHLGRRQSAVDGGKEKGAFPDEQGESWPFNQIFSGFRRNQSAPYSWPRAFRFAASAQVPHRLFPPGGENALAPLCLLSPQNLRFCGGPIYCLRAGRHRRRAARVSRAAKSEGSARSMAMVASDSAIRCPRAAGDQQALRMAFPRTLSGVLRGRRPLFPAAGAGTSRTPAP